MNKISITVRPGADRYSAPNERIIEFSSPHGGGPISFRLMEDGTLIVDPYRLDETVKVLGGAT